MFVAGIEMFFGFVAGMLILVFGLLAIYMAWQITVVIAKSMCQHPTNVRPALRPAYWILMVIFLVSIIGVSIVEVAK